MTGSGKTGRSRTFINPKNTNYKYSILFYLFIITEQTALSWCAQEKRTITQTIII